MNHNGETSYTNNIKVKIAGIGTKETLKKYRLIDYETAKFDDE
jgi:nicotinamide mononucleotide (NMN) deamidase PncC